MSHVAGGFFELMEAFVLGVSGAIRLSWVLPVSQQQYCIV